MKSGPADSCPVSRKPGPSTCRAGGGTRPRETRSISPTRQRMSFRGADLEGAGREVEAQRCLAERPGDHRPRPLRLAEAGGDGAPVGPLQLRHGARGDAEAERVDDQGGADHGPQPAGAADGEADRDDDQQRRQGRHQVAGEDVVLAGRGQGERDRNPQRGEGGAQRQRRGPALVAVAAPGEQGEGGEAERQRHEGERRPLGLADDVAGLAGDEGRRRFPDPVAERELADPFGVVRAKPGGSPAAPAAGRRGRRSRSPAAPRDRGAGPATRPRRRRGRRRSSGWRGRGPRRRPTRPGRGGARSERRERSRAARSRRAGSAARRRGPPASTRAASG